jgi:CheY-like chemotaxis protein
VSDTGKGIDPEFLPYVFDYFRQSDSSITRRFGGLGLGLAIARYLVELHGGTIEAASMGIDKGAVFTVRLPLLQNDPQQAKLGGNCSAQPCLDEVLTGLKILVVEDEIASQELMTIALKQAGATVTAVPSIKDALQCLIEMQPDVLISNVTLQDETGYSLMQQIRLLHPDLFQQIPATALTSFVSEIDEHQTLASGYQHQISKPVDPEELIMAVAALTQSTSTSRL